MKRRTITIRGTANVGGVAMRSPSRFDDLSPAPLPSFTQADQQSAFEDLSKVELDDATAAYVLAMRNPFELLRRSTAQLAGLMVLAASGARNVAAHPMLDLAIGAQAEAEDLVRSEDTAVPTRAEHHRLHLIRANRALAAALTAARQHVSRNDPATVDKIMAPLQVAYRELQWAAFALPGFEIVALSQGCCCAAHAAGRTDN
jgi:hypothetical protein